MIIFRQIKETTINRVNNNAKVVPMHPVKGHKFVAEVILVYILVQRVKLYNFQDYLFIPSILLGRNNT